MSGYWFPPPLPFPSFPSLLFPSHTPLITHCAPPTHLFLPLNPSYPLSLSLSLPPLVIGFLSHFSSFSLSFPHSTHYPAPPPAPSPFTSNTSYFSLSIPPILLSYSFISSFQPHHRPPSPLLTPTPLSVTHRVPKKTIRSPGEYGAVGGPMATLITIKAPPDWLSVSGRLPLIY